MDIETQLEELLEQLETEKMKRSYETLDRTFPMAIGFVTSEVALLTAQEADYLEFLTIVLLTILAENGINDLDMVDLVRHEESIWQRLNENYPKSMEQEAQLVDDDDVLATFLIDALFRGDGLDFLTDPGILLIYSKLQAVLDTSGMSTVP